MNLAEKLRQEGEARGLEKGREQGREQGQREVLLKQLQLRFGEPSPETVARVQASSLSELATMAERMLTAESVDEVLDGGS